MSKLFTVALLNNNLTARVINLINTVNDVEEQATLYTTCVKQKLNALAPNDESLKKAKNVLENMTMRLAKKEKREQNLAVAPKKPIVPNLKNMKLEDKKALLGQLAVKERKLITKQELEAKRMEQDKKDNEALALKQEQSRKAQEAYKAKLLTKTASIVVKPDAKPVNIEQMTEAMNRFYTYQDALKAKKANEDAQNKALDKAIMEKLLKLNS
jgi:acyl transferase domain-containing protein